jgi:hypothetical protein
LGDEDEMREMEWEKKSKRVIIDPFDKWVKSFVIDSRSCLSALAREGTYNRTSLNEVFN